MDLPTHNCRARVIASRVFRRESRLLADDLGNADDGDAEDGEAVVVDQPAGEKGVELYGSYAATMPIPAERAGTAISIPVTNAIEALNSKLRRTVKARGHFLWRSAGGCHAVIARWTSR